MNMRKFVHEQVGAGAIAYEIRPKDGFWTIVCVTIKCSADPGADDFTITLDSEEGGNFDTALYSQDMNGRTSLLWCPGVDIPVAGRTNRNEGDRLDVALANTNSVDIGIIIWMKQLGAR
jgi:hypothetical protein